MLPVTHCVFGLLQLLTRLLGANCQRFLLRLHHVEFFLDSRKLVLILLQLAGQFSLVRHGLVQLSRHLPAAFTLVFEALLNTGDIGPGFVIACLCPVEMLGPFLVIVAQGFQGGLQADPLGEVFLELELGIPDLASPGLQVIVEGLPAQHRQFGFFLALFLLVGLVLFGCGCLALQVLQLAAQLFSQIGQTLQVFLGPADTVLRFPAPLLVF